MQGILAGLGACNQELMSKTRDFSHREDIIGVFQCGLLRVLMMIQSYRKGGLWARILSFLTRVLNIAYLGMQLKVGMTHDDGRNYVSENIMGMT